MSGKPQSYILRDGGSQIVDNDQCGQVSRTGSLCLTFGTGPLSPFLDICHVMVIYHVTNYNDEDWWFQLKRLLIIKTKIPGKDLKIPYLNWTWMNDNNHFHIQKHCLTFIWPVGQLGDFRNEIKTEPRYSMIEQPAYFEFEKFSI